jgi:putative oxygen-independent coproporphyrinogen III oxidase
VITDICLDLVINMKKNLSLYIHIPFCVHKCVYCDFLSFDDRNITDYMQYITAICNEISLYKTFADRYTVKTVYIGGGTPSILDEVMIECIMNSVKSTFQLDRFPEITIEANPGTIKYSNLLKYLEYGINRISIGMQSADNELLKKLGRIHTFEQFEESFEDVRRAGFKNINVDIMSGIPGQTVHSLVDTLTRVTELRPEHISVYSLQVEEGTPLASDSELIKQIPDEETDRQMYAMTKRVLSASGYNRYEISNYSLPGYESRHNSVYWTGGEYIGFGLGAASYFKGERFSNITDMDTYIRICEDIRDEIAARTDGYKLYESASSVLRQSTETIYVDSRMEEFMFLGLRMTQGVSRREFRLRFNKDMFEVYGPVINKYMNEGFMDSDSDRVRLTDKGIDVSNIILADFILEK